MTDPFAEMVEKITDPIARYICVDTPTVVESAALAGVMTKQAEALDQDTLIELAAEYLAAQEDSTRSDKLEKITALVARAVIKGALGKDDDPQSPSNRWISTNITAATRNARRIKAIWRVTAGLAHSTDEEFYHHALKSAQQGSTITPVPGAAPIMNPQPGTEDKMLDPAVISKGILDRYTINPAGLPATLRTPYGQAAFLEAVAQGVALQLDLKDDDQDKAVLWTSAVAGILLVDGLFQRGDQRFFNQIQKALVELGGGAEEDGQIKIGARAEMMFAPKRDASQRIHLFEKTDKAIRKVKSGTIFLQSVLVVARKMAERFADINESDGVLESMAETAYNSDVSDVTQGGGAGGRGGGIANLELPPLNDPAGYNDEIEPDNIRAVSTIYVTYQLEFGLRAAARILDLFVAGLLPISASDGSARELDNLYWDQEDLLDEATRRSLYARVLGAPGGEIGFGVQPNTEFNTLLLRVVSAVSEYEREQSALTHFDNAGRGRRFQSTSGEFVRKAIRDFAANASLRGWAGTAFSAERMATQVRRVMRILGLPAVKNAFGVSTPWQVIERVSQREFGITVNTVLQRTLALETQTIMGIIADRHTIWSNGTGRSLFYDGTANSDLSAKETRELMVACQHFRAVTGVGDSLLDEYSDPIQTVATPSLPDLGGAGGAAGGGMPGIDMAAIGQLKSMVSSGQTPSLDQLRALLPGF